MNPKPPITYRPGTLADNRATYEIFQVALLDLSRRTGTIPISGGTDAEALAAMWSRRRSLWTHLAETADQFWIAEAGEEAVGYGRSIVRDGVQELTELFIRPDRQSAGIGRELMARAFPSIGARHRVIIASSDVRALARYMKAGIYHQTAVFMFSRRPEPVALAAGLVVEPAGDAADPLAHLAAIDREILGHRRDVDHRWLLADRQAFLYRRRGRVAGYGYLSADYAGPFALLDSGDFPAVLVHAETTAHALGTRIVAFEVPLNNRPAIDHLLGRGYHIDPFAASIMADTPFGRLENYILTSPPIFL